MFATDLVPEPPATALPMGRGRFLLFQGVIWALLSVVVVLPAIRFPGVDLAECAGWVSGWAALGVLCSTALAGLYGRLPERQLRGARGILVIGLVCPAMAAVWSVALAALEPLVGREPWAPPDAPAHLYVVVGLVRGTFLLGLWSALFLVNLLSRRVLAAREHSVRAQALADRMQLAVLRSQINPHFLFNALNSVVALIGENPRAAQGMVRDVATLLRASLDADTRRETTVAQELSFVRLYLKCEQVRFEERLVITWDTDPAVETASVPPMMLHPLVENAVKHGMAGAVDAPLQVRITAHRNGDTLDFEVANTGTLAASANAGLHASPGIGLRNVRGRLAHLFPGRHVFELVERDGWVVAHMRLPGGGAGEGAAPSGGQSREAGGGAVPRSGRGGGAMTFRVLIVDDERLARVALRSVLADRTDVTIVGEADSVASARRQIAELSPDVIFLDVNMPGGSGFELFREPVSARVVFCTAYEQFAVRAFEVNALDYLVKPVGPEQIERALGRLPAPQQTQTGANDAPDPPLMLDDVVALRESHAMRFVRVRDIVHLQAADDYSEVHLTSGRPALVDVTLRRWELRLPAADFVRIHRSSLVNLHHVDEVRYTDGRWEIALHAAGEPATLTVSRRVGRELGDRLRARSVRVL